MNSVMSADAGFAAAHANVLPEPPEPPAPAVPLPPLPAVPAPPVPEPAVLGVPAVLDVPAVAGGVPAVPVLPPLLLLLGAGSSELHAPKAETAARASPIP